MVRLLIDQRYGARDAVAATAAMQAVLGAGTVTVGGEGDTFEYVQQSIVDDGISATQIRSAGSDVTVRATAAPDLVVLAVREGSLQLHLEAASVTVGAGELGVVCLGETAELRWERVGVDMFSFPPASVGRLLGSDAQQLRLRCGRPTPKSEALTRLWHRTASVLAEEVLQQQELFESDTIREQAIDALLAVAIDAFEISDIREDDVLTDEARLAVADSFMQTHLTEPITIPDVARAVGVSLRGLQLLYRRRNEETPLLHLRDLRMAAAREALTTGSSSTTTVGAVARRLTYTNIGRFSAHYRDAYGETPGVTLRAARSRAST